MMRSTDDAIERAKPREVAAIFHSDEALEAAVEALLLAGFDRADVDRLADLDEVRRRIGLIYVAHEELADVAQAPRQPVFMREDITATMAVVVGVLASVAGVAAAILVVASGGRTAAAVATALLAALIAGTIGALVTVRIFRPMRSKAVEPLTATRGLILLCQYCRFSDPLSMTPYLALARSAPAPSPPLQTPRSRRQRRPPEVHRRPRTRIWPTNNCAKRKCPHQPEAAAPTRGSSGSLCLNSRRRASRARQRNDRG
jgi:hypothetical protein